MPSQLQRVRSDALSTPLAKKRRTITLKSLLNVLFRDNENKEGWLLIYTVCIHTKYVLYVY